jgi:hypothetical protein
MLPFRGRTTEMTLVAVWYRPEHHDIYAIADSRLTGALGPLTDQAPKFTTARIQCFAQNSKNHFETKVLDREIAIGYAGSSSVAFATIATFQAYVSTLVLKQGSTPTLAQIGDLAKRILDKNFREFGKLWTDDARCDLLIFGFLPTDNELKCFHLGSNVVANSITTHCDELPVVKERTCHAFGSCGAYYTERLKAEMAATGNFHPFNMLNAIIREGARSDIGGFIQVAMASKRGITLPHVLSPRFDLGDEKADVTFLGRDALEIGKVGDCEVGKDAVGPDLVTLAKMREAARTTSL